MDNSTKELVRGILYAPPPRNITLEKHFGIINVSDTKHKSNIGVANKYSVLIFEYKIDKICDATNNDKEIMKILEIEPSASAIARNSGISRQAISEMKRHDKNGQQKAYGYRYHLRRYHFDKIADLVE